MILIKHAYCQHLAVTVYVTYALVPENQPLITYTGRFRLHHAAMILSSSYMTVFEMSFVTSLLQFTRNFEINPLCYKEFDCF